MSESEPKSVLVRWSERKSAARRGDVADEPVAETRSATTPAMPEPDAPALPPIDTLDANSDYTGFLAKNVPEALRRAALRKLWASDPVFATLDGLNDYDEDFNVIDQAITLAQSSYRPGLGYLDEAEQKLDAAEKKLKQIDEAFGGDSPHATVAMDRPANDDDVSDNAAAGDKNAAAVQHAAAAEPDAAPSVPAEESHK